MRVGYTIYPEALARLERGGLIERIIKADDKGDLPVAGIFYHEDVIRELNFLRDNKFYASIPSKERGSFYNKMKAVYKSPQDHPWVVKRPEGELRESCDSENLIIMGGFYASTVLPKKSMGKYKEFGFDSLTDFWGCIGAAIQERSLGKCEEAFSWETKREGGKIVRTGIGGTVHCDLRVTQTDITPYDTEDPLGNKVSYRPKFNEEHKCMAAYHSTEPSLLVGLLKYARDKNIDVPALRSGGQPLFDFAGKLGKRGWATCAEHSFSGEDRHLTRIYFSDFENKLPALGKNMQFDKESHAQGISTNHGVIYLAGVRNEELVFVETQREEKKSQRKVVLSLFPEDIEPALRALIQQANSFKGRTSVETLLGMIRYRFSPELERDAASLRRMMSSQ